MLTTFFARKPNDLIDTSFAQLSVIPTGDLGDPKYDRILADTANVDDAKSLREMIQKADNEQEVSREKSPQTVSEVILLKESLLKLTAATSFSNNLTMMLKEPTTESRGALLKMEASEAIADPNINVIDSHVSQFINASGESGPKFHLDLEEIKKVTTQRLRETNSHNLYRENLQIVSIREEAHFRLGVEVEQWKALSIDDETALIGKTKSSIILLMGHNDTYQQIKSLDFDVPSNGSLHMETLKVWDDKRNSVRNFVVVAVQSQLIWHEISANDLVESHRWNLLKEIDSLLYFRHESSDVLLMNTIDEFKKVQAEFIEFNIADSEFWVIQAFPLPERSPSMTYLDLGRDLIVAFVQSDHVLIYQHQFTKHLRGKFSLYKKIDASNVKVIRGFRIGGHSYLAIGGDEPHILRYVNGDFTRQTILSQSFGFVEEFLPIPIRTYRDDLILLVQHRLELETHNLEVVDALIWNGIAFENALSVPCNISADPNANGFTCMLDLERDEGLLGATFVHHEKENGLFLVIPRHGAHSGLFKVNYNIVDAEDPLLKEMEQIKKSVELINSMMDFEDLVHKKVEEAFEIAVNPRNDFSFENLSIDEIITDLLELDGNVEIAADAIEFSNLFWSHEDFLVDLDAIEQTIAADEQKLKMIDEELNKLNRINRQAPVGQNHSDSPVYQLGTFPINGKLDPKTIRIPQHGKSRPRRQIDPIEESLVASLTAKNIEVKTINGISVSELIFLEDGQLNVPKANVVFNENIEVNTVNMLNDGRVNAIDFSHEVLAIDSPNPPKNLTFDSVLVQNLIAATLNNIPIDLQSLQNIEIPMDKQHNLSAKKIVMRDNLNVKTINGINWDEFVAKLVPKHKPSSIDEINVKGDLIVFGELNAENVNDLPFPSGYVLKDGPRETTITGRKTFRGELRKLY